MSYLVFALALLAQTLFGTSAAFAAVAPGFQDTSVVSVTEPSVLAFAPDGRLFIGEKSSGKIRVFKAGALLTPPFVDLNDVAPADAYFDSFNERGLLGIAFDPSFASNGFLYVYYTLCKTPGNPRQPGSNTCQKAKNRVARFTATGDVANPASHVVLLDDIDSDAGNHNAGWLGFGPLDGKLYVSIGDGGSNSNKAQQLQSLSGKILRLNANGSIPSDNPFVGQPAARGEIWARGFRNPYRCRFASDGRLFCADVGQVDVEELNVVTAGANYGWPTTEGTFDGTAFPQLTNPIHTYRHDGVNAAIIGGDFGAKTAFPGNYQQSFFFADFTRGFIRRALLTPSGVAVQSVDDLVTNIGYNTVTDLVAGPDGSLYYAVYSANQIRRVTATSSNRSPTAAASANPTAGVPPLTVQFSSAGSSDADGNALTYSWSFGDGTATSVLANPTHQYTAPGTYVATLTVSDGQPAPGPGTDTVTITVGRPPVVTIDAPIDGSAFRAGDTIALNGRAVDPEDGAISAANLHWKIIFHHADHIHPFIDDLPGSPQSFMTNTGGEPDADVGYEIQLSATDSTGLTGTFSVFVLPVTNRFTLQTSPPSLGLTLDGQPLTAPVSVTGVVGLHRTIGAPPTQTVGAETYHFAGWSDGGTSTHEIVTPGVDTTFIASFLPPATCNAPRVIPAAGGAVTSATSGTSNQSGTCSMTTNAAEQVYQWTPAVSGTALIETCGGATSFDTVVYVRGGTCTSGTQLACVDDTADCGTTEPNDHHASRVSLGVTAGQTYFIVVDGYDGASGTFTLTVHPPTGAAPTATRTATPVRTATPTVVPTTTATRTTTPASTPSVTAPVVASTPTRTPVPAQSTTPQPAATSTAGPGACDAIEVPAEGGTFTGTTSGTNVFAGTCSVTGSAPERVYRWTPAISGTATIATCGGVTSFDTALYVRAGSCQGAQVVCNDDTAGCVTTEPNDHHGSRVRPVVTAGQTYVIFVDGYNGASGSFSLTITPPVGSSPTASSPTATSTVGPTATASPIPTSTRTATSVATPTRTTTAAATTTRTATPMLTATRTPAPTPTPVATGTPAADACSSITLVPPEGGTFNDTTTGSSTHAGTCGATDKSGERIFQWTPAVSGAATIGTCGSSTLFDTVVYLRSGTCAGSEMVCVDDVSGCATGEPSTYHGSRMSPVVTAGQIYFVVVDGYNGAAGAFSLTITPPAGPSASASATPTLVPTASRTRTATPMSTATSVPTATTTATSTSTSTPLIPTTTPIRTSTPLPSPSATATPSADACANPTILPPEGGTFSGVTAGNNSQAGSCALTIKAPERVFQWTAASSGTATFSTCGNDTLYDTIVYLRGDICDGAELACNDDTTGCGTGEPSTYHGSRLTRSVTAGATYFIVVDGYDTSAGAFALTVVPPAGPTSTPTSTTTATVTRTATPLPTTTPTTVAVTATPAPTSTPLRTGTPEPTTTASPRATTTSAPTAAPTSIPGPCGATVVPAEGGSFTGATSGTNAHAGSCGQSHKGPEAVFQWTPRVSGQATIATCGASTAYDTVLYMRSDTCTGPELGCNDDTEGCGAGQSDDHHASRLTPTVTAGQTYFIVVDGYDGARGSFGLTITPPPDGTCTAPLDVPSAGGVVTGTTGGPSGLADCGQSGLSGEKVHRWTPSTSGVATLETCGGDTRYDTVLYISEEVCGSPGLACVDDTPGCGTASGGGHGSRLTPTVTAGHTYFVVVDGYNGRAGDYSLSIIPPP